MFLKQNFILGHVEAKFLAECQFKVKFSHLFAITSSSNGIKTMQALGGGFSFKDFFLHFLFLVPEKAPPRIKSYGTGWRFSALFSRVYRDLVSLPGGARLIES